MIFLNFAISATARGNRERLESGTYLKMFEKNTIFNDHPVRLDCRSLLVGALVFKIQSVSLLLPPLPDLSVTPATTWSVPGLLDIYLMQDRLPETPSRGAWLKDNLEPGSFVGIDPMLVTRYIFRLQV